MTRKARHWRMCSVNGVCAPCTASSNSRKGRNSTASASSDSYTMEIRRRLIVGMEWLLAAGVLFGIGGRWRRHSRGRRDGRGGSRISRRRHCRWCWYSSRADWHGCSNRVNNRSGRRHDHPRMSWQQFVGRLFRHGFGRQLFLLFFRQLLVLFPLQGFFTGIDAFGACIVFTHHAALLRSKFDPLAHAFMYARLLVGFHGSKAAGDVQPFLLAQGRQLVPFSSQRRQRFLLRMRQIGPQGIVGDFAVPPLPAVRGTPCLPVLAEAVAE